MKKFNDVLVLNRSFCPVHIIDYKRAISHIYQENAHSLDLDLIAYTYSDWLTLSIHDKHFKKIHTVNTTIAIPEIIVLTRFNHLPSRDVKYSRENVMARDKFTCQYCGEIFKLHQLTIDHIIPRVYGGRSTWDNVVASCKSCNSKKGCKSLEEAHMKLIKKPAKPKWINPVSNRPPEHMCKSWNRFLKNMDTSENLVT